MAEASVAFALGLETVTSVLEINLGSGSTPLVGDVSGTFGDAHISGDLNLLGDVFIDGGKLTGIDTFHVQGNGHTIFFQNGGWADLHGVVKGRWGEWGIGSPKSADTTGWLPGDRLAVAPTKETFNAQGVQIGVFVPSEKVWSDWSMTRPVNSLDIPLIDGGTARPEVVNLSQSIVFENLGRGFHSHDSAGIQNLSDVKFLNCGTAGVLGNYPNHFHLLGDNSRGSLLERVVVEGGKNHAFVPHGSHGITYIDCVAYNTTGDAFWWDFPLDKNHTDFNSNDITVDHMLVMWVLGTASRRAGFILGAGMGNSIAKSVATCVQGGKDAAGFQWPESVNQNIGGTQWDFTFNTAHNNRNDGIFAWQNDDPAHVIENFLAYHNGRCQIDHGAYGNHYIYRQSVLQGGAEGSFRLHAAGPIVIEDVLADGPFLVHTHQADALVFVTVRRSQFSRVIYSEIGNDGDKRSLIRFEDSTINDPSDFDLAGIIPTSETEITEAGVLAHRWAGGVWT